MTKIMMIRKNFFNIVILCDPSRAKSKALLKLLESFYVHRAPTRIGLVMAVSAETDKTGENDAGVAMMNAYNYIAGNKEPYDALAFLTDVYSRGESEEVRTVVVLENRGNGNSNNSFYYFYYHFIERL